MSVTAAQGFRAAGVAAGLKSTGANDVALVVNDGPLAAAAGVAAGLKSTGANDVALVVNDGPLASAAGVFTRNRVKAAPVLWSQQVLTAGVVRAVALNSGGANACTGPDGFRPAPVVPLAATTTTSAASTSPAASSGASPRMTPVG